MCSKLWAGLAWGFIAVTIPVATAETISGNFEGTVSSVAFFPQSVGVIVTSDAVYLSAGDVRHWRAVTWSAQSEAKGTLEFVGGSVNHLYFVERLDEERFLVAYDPSNGAQTIGRVPGGPCAFASDLVGLCASDGSLMVTVDGCRTWIASPPVLSGTETVTSLLWVSPSAVVAGGDGGTIAGFVVDSAGSVKPLWSAASAGRIIALAAAGGDIVWAYGMGVEAYDVRRGQKLATVVPDIQVEGIDASATHLYLWGYDGVSVWALDHAGARQLDKLNLPPVAGVVPEGDQGALIVTMDGGLVGWDAARGRAEPASIEVDNTALAAVQELEREKYPTKDEVQELVRRASGMPVDVQQQVFSKANEQEGLTPRARVEWAINELRRVTAQPK